MIEETRNQEVLEIRNFCIICAALIFQFYLISGRPKGSLGKSKLDGKEEDIKELLAKKVSKASIAKIYDISRPALYSFISTRKLE